MDVFRDGRNVGEHEGKILCSFFCMMVRQRVLGKSESRERKGHGGKGQHVRQGRGDKWSGARAPAWRKDPSRETGGQVRVGSGRGGEKEDFIGRERVLELRWLW